MAWTHPCPVQENIVSYNVYCKTVDQSWEEGYVWSVPNTITEYGQEETFTTPSIPANIYYCFALTAVDNEGRESLIGTNKDVDHIECLWYKPEWVRILK